jgi:hypothetical protein
MTLGLAGMTAGQREWINEQMNMTTNRRQIFCMQ